MSSNTQEGLNNTLQDSPITSLETAQSKLEDSDIDVFEGVGNPERTNTAKEQRRENLGKGKIESNPHQPGTRLISQLCSGLPMTRLKFSIHHRNTTPNASMMRSKLYDVLKTKPTKLLVNILSLL
jgi:hypothetical protein